MICSLLWKFIDLNGPFWNSTRWAGENTCMYQCHCLLVSTDPRQSNILGLESILNQIGITWKYFSSRVFVFAFRIKNPICVCYSTKGAMQFQGSSAAGDFLKFHYFYTLLFPVSLQNIIQKNMKNGDCIFWNYFRGSICGFFWSLSMLETPGKDLNSSWTQGTVSI